MEKKELGSLEKLGFDHVIKNVSTNNFYCQDIWR